MSNETLTEKEKRRKGGWKREHPPSLSLPLSSEMAVAEEETHTTGNGFRKLQRRTAAEQAAAAAKEDDEREENWNRRRRTEEGKEGELYRCDGRTGYRKLKLNRGSHPIQLAEWRHIIPKKGVFFLIQGFVCNASLEAQLFDSRLH